MLMLRFLWLQQAVQEGRLKVLSVPTSENLSDTFTKSLSQVDAERCSRCVNFHMKWTTSHAGKHVNELQTISDVIEDLEA